MKYDNTSNVEYQNAVKALELCPEIVFQCLLLVCGVLGNVLVIYVLYTKYKPSSRRTYTLVLAGLDLTNLCDVSAFHIIRNLQWYQFPSDALCKFFWFSITANMMSSLAVLVVIAADR